MDSVQFDEEQFSVKKTPMSGITGWLMKMGWARDQKHANIVLIAVCVGALLLTFFIWTSGFGTEKQTDYEPQPIEHTIIPGPGGIRAGNAQE